VTSSNVVKVRPLRNVRNAPPRRVPNAKARTREYLTPAEVRSLMRTAAKRGRYGQRDATLILVTYRHGLRVSEVAALRWDQIDVKVGLLHVRRLKSGTPSTHPLQGDELRALRYPRRASARRSRASGRRRVCRSQYTHICSATRRASSSPTTDTTRAPCSTGSDTRTSSTPSGTRS
jgi:integrase